MNEPKSPLPRRAMLLAGGAALVAGGLAFLYPVRNRQFNSVDITGADYARDFSLPDTTGRLRSLKDFRGRLLAIFFGFTQCPDVCPTTLTEMGRVKQLLGSDGDKLQVIFITVDPQRDTSQVLEAYMRHFDTQHLALVPGEQQLAEVTKEFKLSGVRLVFADFSRRFESPRELRRLKSLRGLSHEEVKSFFTRGPRTRCSHGARAPR